MMVFKYPFDLGDGDDSQLYMQNAEALGHGQFGVGSNNMWHGGIHLGLKATEPIVAIADGEIIAWRLDRDYRLYFSSKHPKGEKYSTGFVLIKHRINSYENRMCDEGKRWWTFYSLYAHLMPYDDICHLHWKPFFIENTKIAIHSKAHDKIELLSDPHEHEFKMVHIRVAGITGWTNVVNVDIEKQRLSYPISYIYKNDPVAAFQGNAKLDCINSFDRQSAIPVKAGDIIGYGCQHIRGNKGRHFFHFEVFTDESSVEILKNPTHEKLGRGILAKNTVMYTDPPSIIDKERKEHDEEWLLRLGYKKTYPKGLIFDSYIKCNKDGKIIDPRNPADIKHGSTEGIRDPYAAAPRTLYTSEPKLNWYSESDWLKFGWVQFENHRIYSDDGVCNIFKYYSMLKSKAPNNNTQSITSLNRGLVLRHPSEWANTMNESKFKILKRGGQGFPGLGMDYNSYMKFVDNNQFWSAVELPDFRSIWHFHPIDFISHMRSLHRSHKKIPEDVFETYLHSYIKKATFIVERSLENLKRGDSNHKIKLWFGRLNDTDDWPLIGASVQSMLQTRIEKMLLALRSFKVEDVYQATHLGKSDLPIYPLMGACSFPEDMHHRIYIGYQFPSSRGRGSDETAIHILIHEFSHFTDTAATNYKRPDGEREIYPKEGCLAAARNTRLNRNSATLYNANNITYFIMDTANVVLAPYYA